MDKHIHYKRNITLVDDDEAVCHALSVFLEKNGYRVKIFHSAEEFLGKQNGATKGILLLDQQLKEMSGLELQDELTRRGTDLPLIIITGHWDDDICVEAIKSGAMDCLKKPFSNDVLLESVSKAFQPLHSPR